MDPDGFERIFEEHGPLVWSVIRAAGVPRDDAEDLFMQAWESVARNIPRFTGRSKLSTWIAGIARNKCIDYLRRRRPEDAADPEELDGCAEGGFSRHPARGEHTLSPYLRAVAGEARAHITRAVGALPPLQRTVFSLWMEGFDYESIADVSNRTGAKRMDKDHVGVIVMRAREAVRALLRKAGIRGIEDFM